MDGRRTRATLHKPWSPELKPKRQLTILRLVAGSRRDLHHHERAEDNILAQAAEAMAALEHLRATRVFDQPTILTRFEVRARPGSPLFRVVTCVPKETSRACATCGARSAHRPRRLTVDRAALQRDQPTCREARRPRLWPLPPQPRARTPLAPAHRTGARTRALPATTSGLSGAC